MPRQQHGTVRIKRPGDERARTVAATLWNLPDSPFKKQGYKLVAETAPPVGVPAPKKGKAAKVADETPDEQQHEQNVVEE